MASSSSCGHKKSYKYDVFLSFCGEDTRKTFVDHLYAALGRKGIYTFKDDERLKRGKVISEELLQAIEDSRLYIMVFSKGYASSSWCLNELLKIMECIKTNGHTAFPVFYDVDPSDVRKQTGTVGKALAKHENESEVGNWREALKEAADLSGWDVKKTANGHEAKVIELIIEWISLELRPIYMGVDESLVGMEQRMRDLDSCLEIGSNDVRMIGIKGMGGAGKTTLARCIFDKISINFDGKSFVENVREKASGLEKLQEQVLRDAFEDKDITISGVHEGKVLMKKMMRGKKVLVVLDDVDHKDQLEKLAGDTSWFEPGSRIIITTRDGNVLEAHRVKWSRDVNLLSNEEAIHLFNMHVFGNDKPTKEFERHLQEVVNYAAGLPLTIKVLGSHLCGKEASDWADALERLKTIPLKDTLKILEISYENLDEDYKEIFLDVACFLRGWETDDAIRMLESSGFHAKTGLRVLEQKSLITISKRMLQNSEFNARSGESSAKEKSLITISKGTFGIDIINMHDQLVEMAKNIVRREHQHPDEPSKHSRLWVEEDIEQVMADNSVNEATKCIAIRITPGIILEGLGNIKKLRCLIVNYTNYKWFEDDDIDRYNCEKIDEAHLQFPNLLRYLYWYNYPHWCLHKMFEANNLVALNMSHSKIEKLWEGGKVMKKLKFLDLSFSKLRSLNLRLTPKLERLNLQCCKDLVILDVDGGCPKNLVYLNLNDCSTNNGRRYSRKLKSVSFIEQLELLEFLYISRLNVIGFPDYIITEHSCNSLLELDLSINFNIEEIPSSIGNLHKLVSLDISCIRRLKSLPGSICSLKRLRTLKLFLNGIKELPEDLGNLECLEYLDLSNTKVKHLPNSICMLKRLETLILYRCTYLEKLPEDFGELESLEILNLKKCFKLRGIPRSVIKLKRLRGLNLKWCKLVEDLPDELVNSECLQYYDFRMTRI